MPAGVGSVATLISWMKRRAAQDYGSRVVGKTIWVSAAGSRGGGEGEKHAARMLCLKCICAPCGQTLLQPPYPPSLLCSAGQAMLSRLDLALQGPDSLFGNTMCIHQARRALQAVRCPEGYAHSSLLCLLCAGMLVR